MQDPVKLARTARERWEKRDRFAREAAWRAGYRNHVARLRVSTAQALIYLAKKARRTAGSEPCST